MFHTTFSLFFLARVWPVLLPHITRLYEAESSKDVRVPVPEACDYGR